jgi:hypothetical protein
MDKKSRAERRHHRQRMINRIKDFYWIKNGGFSENTSEDKKQKLIRKMVDTRKPCSCYMCCNPRHSSKGKERFTRQEKKFEEYGKNE